MPLANSTKVHQLQTGVSRKIVDKVVERIFTPTLESRQMNAMHCTLLNIAGIA
jgi:hypothetical protein